MKESLVIVESPAKCKTLAKFLGKGYEVSSSMGHLIDLPSVGMGVDVKDNFKPKYVVIPSRRKILAQLKKEAKDKAIIYLATDPDREGEAISWHLARELVDEKKKGLRVEFHEITQQAIEHAFKNPRTIDMNRVNAQQARRILDRVVGYNLSPLLWKKVGKGLSAGRVQSVALRLIVEREEKIKNFIPQEYWEIEAELSRQKTPQRFIAKLAQIDGKKPEIGTKEKADELVEVLKKRDFIVAAIKEEKKLRRPQPPYITSTMQQDAFNRLRFSASKTMKLAQQLYEGLETEEGTVGLITYMRTDSTRIANEAQDEARNYILKNFGARYIPKQPYKAKLSKQKIQEAHEAIRPTSAFRTPDRLRKYLTAEQFRLYELIWRRFLQSQMSPALLNVKTVDIDTADKSGNETKCLFRATGGELVFDGFLRLGDNLQEGDKVEIPPLDIGELLSLLKLIPSQHFTKPPPRFSDASLVKELEEKGIGRPSTYAPIISTLVARHYVERKSGYFYPTEVGIVVTGLLVKHFPNIMNVSFTAEMEDELDKVEEGEMDWLLVLKNFYQPFSKTLTTAQVKMEDVKKQNVATEYICELCKRPMVFRWSRTGTFLGCTGYPKCKNSKPARRAEDGTIELLKVETTDQICDKCKKPMMVKYYKRGKFLSCSDYPNCKNTKPFPTGVRCPQPECGGELVERYSRHGLFYGCSNYPKCKYTSRRLPGR